MHLDIIDASVCRASELKKHIHTTGSLTQKAELLPIKPNVSFCFIFWSMFKDRGRKQIMVFEVCSKRISRKEDCEDYTQQNKRYDSSKISSKERLKGSDAGFNRLKL